MILRRYFFPILAYFEYWLVKEDRFAVQSPQVYSLYNGLLAFSKESIKKDIDLELIRQKLLEDPEILHIEDFGAGSRKLKNTHRKTSSVTKYSTSSRKYSQLYQYFCSCTPAKNVFELGTCVGLNTRYLSRATIGQLFTFEGSRTLWQKAQEFPSNENIQYILGDIKTTLPTILKTFNPIDFVLIDATHTFQGTLTYFEIIIPFIQESSIIALADIHWSEEMNAAWKKIKGHSRVVVSIDFYECGILIFDQKFTKGEYVLDY